MIIKIGSLFSGIGGFELGIERAIPNSKTIWQVEKDQFCQKVLRKHWPDSKIFDDVRNINKNNLEPVDILLGGFPCQDISIIGKGEGINGKRSGLWWEMYRIICEIRPKIICMENVPAITFRGIDSVLGSLASIGYDSEWEIVSARQFGAPHIRERWFAIAYSNCTRDVNIAKTESILEKSESHGQLYRSQSMPILWNHKRSSDWHGLNAEPSICRVDDGLSSRLDKNRLKSLGNTIVPQCAEYIGKKILQSGLI